MTKTAACCVGCGQPSVTLYCDQCAPDPAEPARFSNHQDQDRDLDGVLRVTRGNGDARIDEARDEEFKAV